MTAARKVKPEPLTSRRYPILSAREKHEIYRLRRASAAERVAWLRGIVERLRALQLEAQWWQQAADDIDQQVNPDRYSETMERLVAGTLPRPDRDAIERALISIGGICEAVHGALADARELSLTEEEWAEVERRLAEVTK